MVLQNISGNIKLEKQRDILLIKAEFNFSNKLYFVYIIIKRTTGNGLVPTEQHGLWYHNYLEVVLTKNFFNDIIRQKLWAAYEGSFDALACYDGVVHKYGSMSYKAFGVLLCVSIYILMAIQLIKLFFQKAHGD